MTSQLTTGKSRDVRTVTVWFQNRRQLAKKENGMSSPSPKVSSPNESRQALAIVGHSNGGPLRAPQVAHIPQLEGRSGGQQQTVPVYPFTELQIAAAVFEDPAKLLPFRRNSAIREQTNSSRTTPADSVDEASRKRQRTRFSFCSEDSGDTTDDDTDGLLDMGEIEDLNPPAKRAKINESCPSHLRQPKISIDLSSIFPEDILYGASLLLAFKNSS